MTLIEHGRTRLDTARDRARRQAAGVLALLGALAAIWVAAALAALLTGHGFTWPVLHLRPPVTGGNGGLLGLPHAGQSDLEPTRPQFPLTVTWPSPVWATVLVAVPLWAGWLRLAVRPVLRGLAKPVRHRGLATLREIRDQLSARAARRAARYTRPDVPVWLRPWLHHGEFGMRIGRSTTPRDRRALFANFEQRLRVIARTGWGKTSRLLVPIIRDLPGSALISSTEPHIFNQTARARQHRRLRLRWPLLDRLACRWLPASDYPVAVVDCSPPGARFSEGWPQAQINPIPGSADWPTAHRRARALVHTATGGEDDEDGIFAGAATDVLAAWLHAADLGGYGLDELQAWLADTSTGQPRRVLKSDRRADPSALIALDKHLDPRAEKTTSGVERFVALALASVLSAEGRRLAGTGDNQFDLEQFIASGGTLYLLANPARVHAVRPLLSMIANESFHAAERVALRQRRTRLPHGFTGVLDEVAYGPTATDLPYVVNGQRKYRINAIWSVQSSSQEETVYGPDAQSLRDGAGVSIYGGIDIDAARELSDRAGQTPVVTATRGDHLSSEHVDHQDALSIADQQDLGDGESVVVARGVKPFLAYTESIYDTRAGRGVVAEADDVAAGVEGARARAQVAASAAETAVHYGIDDDKETA